MLVQELNGGMCKTYMVTCEKTKKSLLIDPVKGNLHLYIAMLAYRGYTLDAVVDTHTHADHPTACFRVNDLLGTRIIMSRKSPVPAVTEHVSDGDTLSVGEMQFTISQTPGHTPDSISLYTDGYVFSGDCLLIGGTGRCDFAGGDAGDQYDSITGKLFTLPPETVLLPAHDYNGKTRSTIGHEKSENKRIAGKTRQEYIDLMESITFPLPGKIQEVLQPNQTALDDGKTAFPELDELNKVHQVPVDHIHSLLGSSKQPLLLDVREPKEYSGDLGHIAGSTLIPLKELTRQADGLDKTETTVCICRTGVRSTTAAALLKGMGFDDVCSLKDGMLEWNDQGFQVRY